jgi:cyanophycinase
MVWDTYTYGDGTAFGVLYYRNSLGFAPKKVADGEIGGSGLNDNRTGTSSLQSNYNAGKMPAFGFINFTVDTHFNARGRLGRLTPALVELKERYGIGIDENTSMYYDNGVGTVYGWNGVTVNDLSDARLNSVGYFSISNVVGHYLTQGDKFDFKSMAVLSNKTLISTPYYNGPTDSNDILAAYEATLLQTRLVDQRSLYNLGKTKRPSAFPSTTPTFELKFYRGAQTKGYFGNHKYSVANIIIDFSYATNLGKNLVEEEEDA